MLENILNKIIAKAYAQELIRCQDGTWADPSIGCVQAPAAIVSSESNLIGIILKITNGLMSVVAGIAVITLIYGGIRYAMSAGSEDQIRKAKSIIFWGGFGLIVALLAVFVTSFILNAVT